MSRAYFGNDCCGKTRTMIARFVNDERGATAIEYGLLASFIALGLILAATTLGQKTAGSFDSAAAGFK